MSFVTRFAPSPTGYLHLGHAHAAWAVEAMAQAVGAQMLLRIEDIDPTRCRPEYEAAILEDLAWLGLSYQGPILRQSERLDHYAKAIKRLKSLDLLYPCTCTRKEVLAASPGPSPDGPLYGGTCKGGHADPDRPAAWRLDMARAIQRAGPLDLDPSPWGDLILVRRETPTSYHLSVVLDDAAQGVTHIMRGKDLQGITAVHQLLQRLLGLSTPIYAYHDLVRHEDGRKFSKSERAPAIRDLRAEGKTPEDLKLALNGIPNLRGQIDAIKAGDFL